ncbi:hypothetical protein HYH03_014600 [Edaphochlamys debaryana]|uniref:Uncharacterized protein n=1 Tax=Edaphochlamys debaryana TaxID=47281 RepID=A0A835XRA0_9CHLO|nr:hypothetical protein HYH03_014600 [Edaphochlamys debaryana]|eukprot:KAG2486801.1 hypothetical protein HYH03_014600 [Edaphochlamys debaryana]
MGPRFMCMKDAVCPKSCPGHPTAECIVKVCSLTGYRGVDLKACTPIWYEPSTGDLVTCDAPEEDETSTEITDINTCPPGGIRALCAQTAVCPAKCPGHAKAKCIVKVCAATYRGVELPACTPICCDAGPRYMCTATAVCPDTCPGHPTAQCIIKVCSSTYRGEKLSPCTPIWYEPLTGKLVKCGAHRRVLRD